MLLCHCFESPEEKANMAELKIQKILQKNKPARESEANIYAQHHACRRRRSKKKSSKHDNMDLVLALFFSEDVRRLQGQESSLAVNK